MATHSVFLGFPCGSAGKESTCSAGDLGSIPGLGRSPGEGNGYPLTVFWPGDFTKMVTKGWTRLSNGHFQVSYQTSCSGYSKAGMKHGISLVVPCLRLSAPDAGGLGLIPGQGTRA